MAWNVVASHGPLGLYRGFLTTLSRDIPSFAGYFATYTGLKSMYLKHSGNPETSHLPPLYQLLFGGLAGIGCWVVCYPQDVIKSRIQGASLSEPAPKFSQTVKKLFSEGNSNSLKSRLKPFLRGATPTIVRAFPANAATFLVYEAYLHGFSF
ncbi:hypothetical protein DSO57_1005097 [Entomophthora muscae]|uniref:Uncharacterized protein n=1 Tax=Entomophthora muscae TaxID=34485 RepID=A0ACC2SA55_9FUNG|nr:hypothetical protein DSO57_1005097 [Entomophthora muscae]